jgi:hypothetical protein
LVQLLAILLLPEEQSVNIMRDFLTKQTSEAPNDTSQPSAAARNGQ